MAPRRSHRGRPDRRDGLRVEPPDDQRHRLSTTLPAGATGPGGGGGGKSQRGRVATGPTADPGRHPPGTTPDDERSGGSDPVRGVCRERPNVLRRRSRPDAVDHRSRQLARPDDRRWSRRKGTQQEEVSATASPLARAAAGIRRVGNGGRVVVRAGAAAADHGADTPARRSHSRLMESESDPKSSILPGCQEKRISSVRSDGVLPTGRGISDEDGTPTFCERSQAADQPFYGPIDVSNM